MNRWQRAELVEARADLILVGEHTAEAYADYFESQMHPGNVPKLFGLLRMVRRTGAVLRRLIL